MALEQKLCDPTKAMLTLPPPIYFLVCELPFQSINEEISFSTDSASAGNPDLGVGLLFKKHWVFFPWSESWRGKEVMFDITFLELLPIVLSICLFRHYLLTSFPRSTVRNFLECS
jgi:hypothetical protein